MNSVNPANSSSPKPLDWRIVLACLGFLALFGFLIYSVWELDDVTPFEKLGLAMGWILAVLIGSMGLIIVVKMAIGKIDLRWIISEPDGHASLSRFQFLIFTFVISMSLFLIVVSNDPIDFPVIPLQILGLLGMSGGSYVISKGIQTSRDTEEEKVKKKVKGEVKEEAKQELRGEVKEEAKKEVREEVKEEAKQELRGEVREEVKKEVREEVKEEAKQELRGEVREEVKREIEKENNKPGT